MIGLLVVSRPFRKTETGKAFYLLSTCVLIWIVGFIFETLAVSLYGKIFFANLQFLGLCFLPLGWVYLTTAHREFRVPRKVWILLALLPVMTNLVIWTNPFHHWFRGTPYIDTNLASFPVLVNDYQFWFYLIHAPSGYLYLAGAIIALVYGIGTMQPVYRKQTMILLVAALLPLISDILYVLGYSPIPYYNLTPAVFSVSVFLIAWGLFRYQWLELRPLARDIIFENLQDGVIVLDAKDRIIDFNPRAEKIVNLTAEAIGKTPGEVRLEMFREIERLMGEGQTKGKLQVYKELHITYDVRLTEVKNPLGQRAGRIITFYDSTEVSEQLSRLQDAVDYDHLTGALSRKRFTDLVEIEFDKMRAGTRRVLSLVFADLDEFKKINDEYGHHIGDKALVKAAQRIQQLLRPQDIFGRFGGDEFAILFIDTDAADVQRIAERLRRGIEKIFLKVNGQRLPLTASFGIMMMKDGGISLTELFIHADEAMYQAKHRGGNCVVLYDFMKADER